MDTRIARRIALGAALLCGAADGARASVTLVPQEFRFAQVRAEAEGIVDDETVTPQEGGFYGGWITSRVVGPFKGIPGSWGW